MQEITTRLNLYSKLHPRKYASTQMNDGDALRTQNANLYGEREKKPSIFYVCKRDVGLPTKNSRAINGSEYFTK